MDDRFTVDLYNAQQAHPEIQRLWRWCKAMLINGHKLTVEACEEKRSEEQNNMLWSILADLSEQVEWVVDGQTTKLARKEWKDILTAGLKHEQRVAKGINGGVVILGTSTRKMPKSQFSQLLELAWAFGAQHDVRWRKTSLGRNCQVGEEA